MQCVAIDTAEALRAHYPLLEEACARVTAREDRVHFAPDIYAALMRGEGRAFLVYADTAVAGVFIVNPCEDARKRPALRLWLGYARPGFDAAFTFGLAECELMALEQGCASLVFGTQRRGWLRHAPRFGFEVSEFQFEKQVTP